jgi:hypothetical protein
LGPAGLRHEHRSGGAGRQGARRSLLKDIRPATSMVEVSRLITPKILVEIEADALVQE